MTDPTPEAAIRHMMQIEADASVALDRDPAMHTCHDYCDLPACVARRERESNSGEAAKENE